MEQHVEQVLIKIEGSEETLKKLSAEEHKELVKKLTTLHKFCKEKNLLISQSSLKYDKENEDHERLLLKVSYHVP